MITSSRNPKIQHIRALQSRAKARREAGAFIVEGVRLAEEALAAGWLPQLALFTAGLGARGQQLLQAMRAQNVPVEEVAEHVLQAASDTQAPQGLLLVLPAQTAPQPDNLDFVLIADQVRDPGNLGTMLRSAAAAGVQAVFLPPGGVDAFAPKVLRAAMGAHFRVPVVTLGWAEIQAQCTAFDLNVYLAAAGEGQAHTAADLKSPAAIIIGGEAAGAGDQAYSLKPKPLHIPMPGGSESLNASIAAAIILFEVVRQRSTAS
ncbi:MAG: RNA methyltransferase [Anaerolineae bacterium]|nr:RNA methyltransferase [Anaerolineae bacterium]